MNKSIKRIALFGTSADPPTKGHQSLLEGLIKLFPKVITWASNNPMKSHVISLTRRQELLETLVNSMGNDNIKLVQELSSQWTIKTIEKAEIRWPKSNFTFVIGSDLVKEIPHWLNAQEFLKKTRIGIAPREGWPIQNNEINKIESLGGKIDLLPLEIPHVSSTEIRTQTKLNNIPTSVLQLIIKDNLYGITNIRGKE